MDLSNKNIKNIVRESIQHVLLEARMDGFRLDALRDMPLKKRIAYCKQWLGEPIGEGSSRMVFQLDDETVLKLAMNKAGIAQNAEEYQLSDDYYAQGNYNFLVKVYNGSDEENNEWLISEYVLPAKAADFKEIIGKPFSVLQNFIYWAMADSKRAAFFTTMSDQEAVDLINNDNTGFFASLEDFIRSYDYLANVDLVSLRNWGIVLRDGKPSLVILDTGLSDTVFRKYYLR